MPPPSPRPPAPAHEQPSTSAPTPDHSTLASRSSSPALTARPTTPPPSLPPPTLQELGLSLSVLTSNLAPSHFSTPPASGAFLAPHYLLLCHAQGLDVLPLVSPPAPQPYALIRRVSFKSVVVMEHRGVLVAIAGRRDGVRVYALEEVKKAVEWRLDMEVRREQDRARREESKRGIHSRDSGLSDRPSREKLGQPSSSARSKSARKSSASAPSTASASPAKAPAPTNRKIRTTPPQSPPQPPHPPALVPSVPPPPYSSLPLPGRPRSPVSVHTPRERRTSVGNVLAGSITRRNTDAAVVGRDFENDADAKGDWVEGRGSSDDEAINVVAAGTSGSEALDERTSAMAAASSSVVPPIRPLSSSTLTPQSVRRPRPANLDLSMLPRVPSATTAPPSPTPTLITLRQALSTSPAAGPVSSMGSLASRMDERDEPATPDGDDEGTHEDQRTPTNEQITFAEALSESRLPDVPPPGSRRVQAPIMITASHPVATGDDDVPASPQSAETPSFRTRLSQDTQANNLRRRRWSVLGNVFTPSSSMSMEERRSMSVSVMTSQSQPLPVPASSSQPQLPSRNSTTIASPISATPTAAAAPPEMRARSTTLLSRSHSSTFHPPPAQPPPPESPRPSSSPSARATTSVDGPSVPAPVPSHSRFLSRIIGNAFASRRSEDSMHQQVQRVEQADGARKSSGTPTAVAAPAPKLEYVKLPGTKGALMIKAVETSKKRSV